MIELKLSQGAKPGKGGILPAAKVTEEIARIRGIEPGRASLSPNRHVEIDGIHDLLNVLDHIREISGKPVGYKAVIGDSVWLDDLCEEIHRRGGPVRQTSSRWTVPMAAAVQHLCHSSMIWVCR